MEAKKAMEAERGTDLAKAVHVLVDGLDYSQRHFAELGHQDKVAYLNRVLDEAVCLLRRQAKSR